MEDLDTSKKVIIGSGLIAMILGMAFMIIMKTCAACITWTAILLFLVACGGIANYTYKLGLERQKEIDAIVLSLGEDRPKNYTMWTAYAFSFITFAMICTICCLYSRIQIAIKIMQTSADFITEVPTVLAVAPIITVSSIIWALLWVYLAIYVFARGKHSAKSGGLFYG